jgi:hypothetical protein
MIYKYCLIANDENDTEIPMIFRKAAWSILISKDLKPPALLAVCQQVRMETLCIFCLSNRFHASIEDYDASLYLAWQRLRSKIEARNVFFRVKGDPNWKNLRNWCQNVWSGHNAMSKKGSQGSHSQIVDAAHRIAVASRGKTWAECELQLDELRRVLGQVDRGWLN